MAESDGGGNQISPSECRQKSGLKRKTVPAPFFRKIPLVELKSRSPRLVRDRQGFKSLGQALVKTPPEVDFWPKMSDLTFFSDKLSNRMDLRPILESMGGSKDNFWHRLQNRGTGQRRMITKDGGEM
jgi:hypothetical protein